MDLGIAGNPGDVAGVVTACERFGVSPVFVLGPHERLPSGIPAIHVHHVPSWDVDECTAHLKRAGLCGLWAAQAHLHGAVARIASRLHLPHMPCPAGQNETCPLTGAPVVALPAVEDSSGFGLDVASMPVWVRPACGDGDASCMRVEHVGDLPLASQKLRKRGISGAVRLQPALEGAVLRLPAFKVGRDLLPLDLVAEETTSSMYRVPLGFAMPLPRRGDQLARALAISEEINRQLPPGWGYLECEFVDTGSDLVLVDIRAPASLDPLLRQVVQKAQGVDLLHGVIACALGRPPQVTPTRELGAAATWLLTRSGTVTGFKGVEGARAMPGVDTVVIVAKEGDALTHVVDIPTRERGGYILATGSSMAVAKERLEAARVSVWINTSPVKS